MRISSGFCLLFLIGIAALADEPSTKVLTAANVQLPGIGSVHIQTTNEQGRNPLIQGAKRGEVVRSPGV